MDHSQRVIDGEGASSSNSDDESQPGLVSDSDGESDDEDMPFAPPKAGEVLASMRKLA